MQLNRIRPFDIPYCTRGRARPWVAAFLKGDKDIGKPSRHYARAHARHRMSFWPWRIRF